MTVSEWHIDVKARMAEMAQLVSTRETKAKEKMKQFYDRGAKMKTLQVGEMVIVREPGLVGKMGDTHTRLSTRFLT